MNKFYYTYVLLSLKDEELYTGWSDDLKARVEEHNQGLVEATKFLKTLEAGVL